MKNAFDKMWETVEEQKRKSMVKKLDNRNHWCDLETCVFQRSKQAIREHIYLLAVEKLGVALAGHITGILLELDNFDLVDMLKSHSGGGRK